MYKNNTFALILSVIYFFYNFVLMQFGHFEEDAYILFIYVENLVNGNGITFFPGGQPTEGATDFLWMILISGLVKLGLDVGTSVILLNTLGIFIISSLLVSETNRLQCPNTITKLIFYGLIFLVMFQHFLWAALGGFSVNLYLALILLTFKLLEHQKKLFLVPVLGLTLGLFRPDGVILGVIFALIGLFYAKEKKQTKNYIVVSIFSIVLGSIYFYWRYNYFGNLLPLPLYVKSSMGGFAGAQDNIRWLIHYGIILLATIYLSFKLEATKRYLTLCSPALVLYLILFTAEQSQNIGMRFQAPLFIVVFGSFTSLLIAFINQYGLKSLQTRIIVLSSFTILSLNGALNIYISRHLVKFDYINDFPSALNQTLLNSDLETVKIAMTEAGRIPYWNQHKKIQLVDLVGLNTEYPAKHMIDINYVASITPDILMYHHSGLVDLTDITTTNTSAFIIEKNDFKIKPIELHDKLSKVMIAAAVSNQFLYDYQDLYDIILVNYKDDGQFYHVYGIKKELGITEHLLEEIQTSFEKRSNLSYYQLKAQRSPISQ